jgi:hypothetical protein
MLWNQNILVQLRIIDADRSPIEWRSKAPGFRFHCLNLTCASKKISATEPAQPVNASTLHSAVTTRWRSRKKLVTCYWQGCGSGPQASELSLATFLLRLNDLAE